MSMARPTGGYAGAMLDPGGWPEVDEDALYERARQFTAVLGQISDVLDATRRQQMQVFDGGIWSGGAAAAANGELGANVVGLHTLQNGLATVITWHQHVAGTVEATKVTIAENLEVAHQRIAAVQGDPALDDAERQTAINSMVAATYGANVGVVTAVAEQIRASKSWKPPSSALQDLLDRRTPPPFTVPELSPPAAPPSGSEPSTRPPRPALPRPGPGDGTDVGGTPQTPPAVTPPAGVTPPVSPGRAPGTPATPPPGTPATPPPGTPATPPPGTPATPPPGAPGGAPAGQDPSAPDGVPVAPVAGAPPGAAPTPPPGTGERGGRGKGLTPASAGATTPAAGRGQDASAPVVPAAASAQPPAGGPMTGGAMPGGAAAGSSTGSGAPVGARPAAASSPSTRPASTTSGRRAPTRPTPPPDVDAPDRVAPSAAPMGVIPVSQARAQRDAVAGADAARRRGPDRLALARRLAAALNAPRADGPDDIGFFWVTGLTTDGAIVVANSYGLAYIPDGVELPDEVHMATADETIAAVERARWATYPVMAVQGWAAHHDTKLRAVIATEAQLAGSDAGAAKVVLTLDDIPEHGDMVGRSRLAVVDPPAAQRLSETREDRLTDLLPPAPVGAAPANEEASESGFDELIGGAEPSTVDESDGDSADKGAQVLELLMASDRVDVKALVELLGPAEPVVPPSDRRGALWLEVLKPMTSQAVGREVAHLRAFHVYAEHAAEVAAEQGHDASDPDARRTAVEGWLYWKHLSGLLGEALAGEVNAQSPS